MSKDLSSTRPENINDIHYDYQFNFEKRDFRLRIKEKNIKYIVKNEKLRDLLIPYLNNVDDDKLKKIATLCDKCYNCLILEFELNFMNIFKENVIITCDENVPLMKMKYLEKYNENMINEPENMINEPENMINEPENMINEPENMINEPKNMINEPKNMSFIPLVNYDLSNWDVSQVKNMESMFEGAKSLNSDLLNWDFLNLF